MRLKTLRISGMHLVAFGSLLLFAVASRGQGEPEDPKVRPFRSIQQLFTQSCALTTCHSAVARQGGLVLEHEDLSYRALVDTTPHHPDAKALGLLRVASGDPERSFLLRKLKGMGPGDTMPQGGGRLSDEIIEMVEEWIRRGAHATVEECPAIVGSGEGGTAHHGSAVPTICDDKPPEGDYVWEPEPPLEVPERGSGVQMYIPPKPVDPGTEWEYCYATRFKDLPNADAALLPPVISRQEYRMHEGSHHLLLYVYFGGFPDNFAEGWYPCFAGSCLQTGDCPSDTGPFTQITIGGTQVAGTRYIVSYPEGVGLPLLGGENAVLIANIHYTNPFQPAQDIYGEAWLNLYFHRPEEFKVILDGIFAINWQDLLVEPYQTRTISRLWRPVSFISRQPADAAVFQLFGHMHKRGREFSIDFVDRYCACDCNSDGEVDVSEVLTGINILFGRTPMNRCANLDRDRNGQAGIEDLVAGVEAVMKGCSREPDIQIYHTTEWDNAPVQEYGAPYLKVDRDQALRWTCTHENGRLLENGEEDPTYPSKKCHEGCRTCGWRDATRDCSFRDGRVFQEGEPMPVVFGELADDDMCNMFGYFIRQEDLPLLGN
jgi:hypothetical protein